MSEKLLTVGEIANRIGCPIHRVEYLVRSRNIHSAQRAGNLRVFSESDLKRIAAEVQPVDAEVGHEA